MQGFFKGAERENSQDAKLSQSEVASTVQCRSFLFLVISR